MRDKTRENQKLGFGKYRDDSYRYIALYHPEYISWARSLPRRSPQLQALVDWVDGHDEPELKEEEEPSINSEQRGYQPKDEWIERYTDSDNQLRYPTGYCWKWLDTGVCWWREGCGYRHECPPQWQKKKKQGFKRTKTRISEQEQPEKKVEVEVEEETPGSKDECLKAHEQKGGGPAGTKRAANGPESPTKVARTH